MGNLIMRIKRYFWRRKDENLYNDIYNNFTSDNYSIRSSTDFNEGRKGIYTPPRLINLIK